MTSDLERRLTESLHGTGSRAPQPADLGAGARRRLRRRRRTSATVAAAALALVGVPVGVLVAGGGGADPERREPTARDRVPADWRTETWRDLSVRVPPGWTWGSGTDWCASGDPPGRAVPQVSRPGGVVQSISCSPSSGFGVHFAEPASGPLPPGTEGAVQQYRGGRYPDGAWLGYAATRHAAVWVVTDDRTVARLVMDSVEPVGVVDANGCSDRAVGVAPGAGERVSVCRYGRDGWLQQSELLSPDDSAAAAAAVADAPGAGGAALPVCATAGTTTPVVTLQSGDLDARLLRSPRCWTSSVFVAGSQQRRLTDDVLFWALSPGWSGSLERGLPVPDRFRDGG